MTELPATGDQRSATGEPADVIPGSHATSRSSETFDLAVPGACLTAGRPLVL